MLLLPRRLTTSSAATLLPITSPPPRLGIITVIGQLVYTLSMETKVIKVDPAALPNGAGGGKSEREPAADGPGSDSKSPCGHPAAEDEGLKVAAALLREGHVVGIPTETVYGLAANALDGRAATRIYQAKNRPPDNPLICHVSNIQMISQLVDPQYFEQLTSSSPASNATRNARLLMDRFWPGPLTLLLPKGPAVPDVVTAGQPTVAVRLPSHPVAKALIQLCGFPLAAPSANSSGNPSPTLASHVVKDLGGKIPLVIDGGPSRSGIESTVVDVVRDPPVILRPGGVTLEQIREVVPGVLVYSKDFAGSEEMEEKPSTPGMKYRHYSPKARVLLFEGSDYAKLKNSLTEELRRCNQASLAYGLVLTHQNASYPEFLSSSRTQDGREGRNVICRLGKEDRLDEVAHGLFKMLRDMDDQGVEVILVEGVSEEREGLAVMNRLRKAASKVVSTD